MHGGNLPRYRSSEMIINVPLILECLEEWSSRAEQERLWLSDGSSGFVGSPVEAYEGLFGDSHLVDALEEGSVHLPRAVVDSLASMRGAIDRLDPNSRPREFIDHPGMIEVRRIAGELLVAFRELSSVSRQV
jgi:hypothetical protein